MGGGGGGAGAAPELGGLPRGFGLHWDGTESAEVTMEPRQKQTASEEHSRSKGVSRSMRGSVCCCLTSEVPASLLREASISLRDLHPAEEGSKGRGSQLWSSFTSIGVGRERTG